MAKSPAPSAALAPSRRNQFWITYPPGEANAITAAELLKKLDAGQSVVAPPGFGLIVIAPPMVTTESPAITPFNK